MATFLKPIAMDQIAECYGVSRQTVRRAVRRLEAEGIIKAVRQGGGRGKVRTYAPCEVREHLDKELRKEPFAYTTMDTTPAEPIGYGEWVQQCIHYNAAWGIAPPPKMES